jgi:hypothetical protein
MGMLQKSTANNRRIDIQVSKGKGYRSLTKTQELSKEKKENVRITARCCGSRYSTFHRLKGNSVASSEWAYGFLPRCPVYCPCSVVSRTDSVGRDSGFCVYLDFPVGIGGRFHLQCHLFAGLARPDDRV